ncbi:DUF354 domain-containing protein [Natronosalvus vescus]|uniref:DUF354 domain-containing protein n=1 Tax=Natronosalvus vescus TaxID=2953881 RepID=UPI0020905D19|nr:DUF354 domain-containing protein [Natronosalvus vescus]
MTGLAREKRIVVTIQHPAHVHVFKHPIAMLESQGYEVHVFARERPLISHLLDNIDIDYQIIARQTSSLPQLAATQCAYEFRLLREIRALQPVVAIAIGEPSVAHASSLLDCRSIVLTDTEHAKLQNGITFPFADIICTPSSYWDELGAKQVRYPGFHELAYLHPHRFIPDESVADLLPDTGGHPLVLLRLVSWAAAHDVGQTGIAQVASLIHELEAMGATVVISAESPLPPSLANHRLDIPPHAIHDFLHQADLIIGESATMAIESAILGTPALYISSLHAGVLEELEARYGLLYRLPEGATPKEVATRAKAIINKSPSVWEKRRKKLLDEKIDTASFIVNTVKGVASS